MVSVVERDRGRLEYRRKLAIHIFIKTRSTSPVLPKEVNLFLRSCQKVFSLVVLQDVVERDRAGADRGIVLALPVPRLGHIRHVDGAGEQMIDAPTSCVLDDLDVSSGLCLGQEVGDDRSLIPISEVIELPAKEVPGVDCHQIQEAASR